MGFRSFIKKVGKKVKKYAAPALGIAGLAAPFIPGVGSAISGAISKVGGWLTGGSSAANPPSTNPNQVEITGQREGFDWGGLAKAAIPAIGSYFGQKATNIASAEQADRQMDFQAEQTGTSYQRGIADMKAAGLNPMLAYSQGGASSGSGAQAPVGNEVQAGISSAVQAMMTRQQLQQMQAQIENITADTSNKDQQTTNLQSENLYTLARTAHENAQIPKTHKTTEQIALSNALASATQSSNIRLASSAADLRRSEAEREQYLAKASKYDLSRAGAWSKFYDSGAGKAYPYLSTSAEIANSAAGAVGKLNPFKFGR